MTKYNAPRRIVHLMCRENDLRVTELRVTDLKVTAVYAGVRC